MRNLPKRIHPRGGPKCQRRFALLLCLASLLFAAGCATFRVQEQDRVSFDRAKEVVREVTRTINGAAKPQAQPGGEAQIMLQSIPRTEADITGALGVGKIAVAEVGNLKGSVLTYQNGLSDLVKAATSDEQRYSLSAQQRADLATKADSVKVMLAGILLNLDMFIGTQRDQLDKKMRLAVSTLGSAFMTLDTVVMQKLTLREAKGENVADTRKQWVQTAGTWLDIINTALKDPGGPLDASLFNTDKLASTVKAAFGPDSSALVEVGFRLAVSSVSSYIPRGAANDETKRILNIIQTEFDKIVNNYNTQHPHSA